MGGKERIFNSKNILNETRFLTVGDFIWIKDEKVYNLIVERKQSTDFISSVFDSRFREQKNRLSGLNGFKVFYLIENIKYQDLKENLVNRCLLETRLCGFILLETNSIIESANLIKDIDYRIRNNNFNFTVSTESIYFAKQSDNINNEISYGSFLEDTNKNNYKASDFLLIALLGVKGLSKDFSIEICKKFGTLINFKRNLKFEILSQIKFNKKTMSDKMICKIINMFN